MRQNLFNVGTRVALHTTVGCICSVRFETLNFQLQMNLIRKTNVKLTTEPHITYTPCYV